MADNPAIFRYRHSKTVERVVFLRQATKFFAYDWVPLGLVHMIPVHSTFDAEGCCHRYFGEVPVSWNMQWDFAAF